MEITQEALDKILGDMKDSHAHSMEQLRVVCEQQSKLIQFHCNERLAELNRQNDGLLGAVGRLQVERDSAIKELEDHKTEQRQREEEMKLHTMEVGRAMEREQEKRSEEISGYKREITNLQAKLKKQTKK